MANKARGEVDVEIGGTRYSVAMTLAFMAAAADALETATIDEFEGRLVQLRPADMPKIMRALADGNGLQLDDAALGRLSFKQYQHLIIDLYQRSRFGADDPGDDGESKQSPRKRAA